MNQIPTDAERRRRILTRALPLAALALIAFIVGITAGASGSPDKDAAARFAHAWTERNFKGMYAELNEASRQRVSLKDLETAYREAELTATAREVEAGSPGDAEKEGGTATVPVAMAVQTVAFGTVEQELQVPYADGGIEWNANLVFPGLRPGEELAADVELAERAPILARDGTALAEGPAAEREHPLGSAAIDVTGEVGEAPEEDWPRLARHGFSPKPRSGSAASSAPSTTASPASPAASCSPSPKTAPRSAPWPSRSRRRGRR